MTINDQSGQTPLPEFIVRALLTELSTNDNVRTLFITDPKAALVHVGMTAAEADVALLGSICLHNATLPGKEALAAALETYVQALTSTDAHTLPFCSLGPASIAHDHVPVHQLLEPGHRLQGHPGSIRTVL